MDDILKCPIHDEKLKVSTDIVSVLGTNYNMMLGRCSRCRVIYIDQTIHGIGKFTYEGKIFQYLPQLEQWRIKKQQQQEEERKQKEEKKKLIEKFPFLKGGDIKIRIAPSKSKWCPEHGWKLRRIFCEWVDDSTDESMSLNGGYCRKCNALYISSDLEEEIKKHGEYSKKLKIKQCGNILIQETPMIKVSKIQFPEKQPEKQKKIENRRSKKEERYPFVRCGHLRMDVIPENVRNCPVHQSSLEALNCVLKNLKRKLQCGFTGFYCPVCNCIYQDGTVGKWMKIGNMRNNANDYKLVLTQNRWKKSVVLNVSEFSFLKAEKNKAEDKKIGTPENVCEIKDENTKPLEEAEFKRVAYRKFGKEIAEVAARVDGLEKYIRILTTVGEEDKRRCTPEEMLIREAETLGREILGRIAHGQLNTFYAKEHKVTIYQYKIWPGQEHHLDGFTKFSNPEKMQDITIMSQKTLGRDSEEYEMVTALVFCSNRQEPVYIDVYYSKRQDRYFINDESYRQYSSRYGLPYMRLLAGEYDGDLDYGSLRQYSELNLYGYTVAKSADMTTGERQTLLKQLIDNGLMSKHQIVNHLEWLIHRQSGRISMEDACDCWKEDLKFVNHYKIDQQRRICGRFVYGKTALR